MDLIEVTERLLARGKEQQHLFAEARKARETFFGWKVEVRSVIEYSNICAQECKYCGMNYRSRVKRYVLDPEKTYQTAEMLYSLGRRVIMFQTGEYVRGSFLDGYLRLIKKIKRDFPDFTMICCSGNLPTERYHQMREIGVERYILKFETSNAALYKKIKPSDTLENRLAHIAMLKNLGFQVGTGSICGLPGQTVSSIAQDLLLLRELNIPMGSVSVFIPNNLSAFAGKPPGDIQLTLNAMAILRILCPRMCIPTTSSLELLIEDGQYLGLMAGANTVTLHDGTPKQDEDNFVIYNSNRHKPTFSLFSIVNRAGLECVSGSLVDGVGMPPLRN